LSSIKIKQISTSNNVIYALSEDGIVYKYSNKNKWIQIPEINENTLITGIKNEEIKEI